MKLNMLNLKKHPELSVLTLSINKLRKTSPNKKSRKSPDILPTINSKYNEVRNKLALRRKTLKESSGSNNDDEWGS